MGGRRFAVLLCADDSDYMKSTYGGYFGVFKEMLAEEGESWEVFRASRGELPDESQVESIDGFVITGSCSDAHGYDSWILGLVGLLCRLDASKKKVLGICFGAQIMGRALGGKVGRAKSWDIGLRSIQFSEESKLSQSLKLPSSIPVIECHRDEVKELPSEAVIVAKSDKTRIEAFTYGKHFMGIQGHPEYTQDILRHLIDRLLQRDLITDSYAEELRANLEGCEPDRKSWKSLCLSFLKG
ncbi:hypothetical protein MLD38_032153 [Melastoma candidum]|uniref:Uncharacterized protein n=1 Tax=Melastoma candidum TaxID=119954 RepID=A0ACB9M4S4_9MYRT|nr:hypothetical protein MLD38_032153 [Melastoma candidum]